MKTAEINWIVINSSVFVDSAVHELFCEKLNLFCDFFFHRAYLKYSEKRAVWKAKGLSIMLLDSLLAGIRKPSNPETPFRFAAADWL